MARWLQDRCDLLIVNDATVGVDVGVREDIYRAIRKAAADGAAVILITSDFEEIEAMCHRALVLVRGVLAKALKAGAVTQAEITRALTRGAATTAGQNRQRSETPLGEVTDDMATGTYGRGLPTRITHHLARSVARYSLVLVLIALIVGFSAATPVTFFTLRNFEAIAVNQLVVVFVALALVGPLILGELDLSVGFLVGFSQALIIGYMTRLNMGIPLAMLCAVLICGAVGLVNGLLVVKVGINSLIATLATGNVIYGLVLWYTNGTVMFQDVPPAFLSVAGGRLLGVPLPLIYAAVFVLVAEVVLRHLPIGRRVHAVGGNRRAARLTGIPVDRIIIGAFVFTGITCAVGGVVIASRLGSAQPELGPQFLLPAYSAAFLGATTIQPGRFNPLGTVVAVYVIAVIVAGLQQLGVPYWAEYIVYGLASASGVALSLHLTRLRDRQAARERLRAYEADRRRA